MSRGRHELTGAPLIGTEKQRHVGRVASAETPRTAECNSTRGLGVFSRKSSAVQASCVCDELLRVCLDDHETLDLLCSAAEDFARAQPPHDVMRTFMLANITALQKKDGGVRGIATGTSFQTFGVEDSDPTIHDRSGG